MAFSKSLKSWRVWAFYTCSGSSSTTSTIQRQTDEKRITAKVTVWMHCTLCLVSGRWPLKCNQITTQAYNIIDTHCMICICRKSHKIERMLNETEFTTVLLWVYIICRTWHVLSDICGRRIPASKYQSKLCFLAVLAHGTFENFPSLKCLRNPLLGNIYLILYKTLNMQPSGGLQKPWPNLSIDMTPRILSKMLQLSEPTHRSPKTYVTGFSAVRLVWK